MDKHRVSQTNKTPHSHAVTCTQADEDTKALQRRMTVLWNVGWLISVVVVDGVCRAMRVIIGDPNLGLSKIGRRAKESRV
jgi:hypothetical protein